MAIKIESNGMISSQKGLPKVEYYSQKPKKPSLTYRRPDDLVTTEVQTTNQDESIHGFNNRESLLQKDLYGISTSNFEPCNLESQLGTKKLSQHSKIGSKSPKIGYSKRHSKKSFKKVQNSAGFTVEKFVT